MIDLLLLSLRDAALGFTIAVGFSFLFNTPPNARLAAGLLGGLGHMIRFLLLFFGWGLVTSTLIGAVTIGLVSIYVTRVVNTPPVVFSMPACITMIPGLYAYRTMLGFIKIVDLGKDSQNNALLSETVYYLVLTASLLFTLAIGITIAALLFRQKTTRNIKLPRDVFTIFGRRR